MTPKLPPRFEAWITPWQIRTLVTVDDDGHLVEWEQWVRTYRERSHCDTSGCCQFNFPVLGPQLSDPTIVPL